MGITFRFPNFVITTQKKVLVISIWDLFFWSLIDLLIGFTIAYLLNGG
jgi:hypothetical protein